METIDHIALQDNTSQRLPCVLVLDGSGSMEGNPISELNQGLKTLEEEDQCGGLGKLSDNLPLFSVKPSLPPPTKQSAVEKVLCDVNPDALSPREALNLLYQLKELFTD